MTFCNFTSIENPGLVSFWRAERSGAERSGAVYLAALMKYDAYAAEVLELADKAAYD